jgi:TIR domain
MLKVLAHPARGNMRQEIQEAHDSEKSPRVFISYSHDSADHKTWVLNLALRLLENGVEAILDVWDLKPGADAVQFMRQSVTDADRVLMICTEKYTTKINTGQGGAGVEAMVVSGQLIKDLTTTKFIPLIRQKGERILPDVMATRLYIDFSNDEDYDKSFELLLRELLNAPAIPKPSLGRNPFKEASRKQAPSAARPEATDQVLALLKEANQDDLIRAFFHRQITLSSLDDICQKHPDAVIKLLPGLAEREWGSMILRYLARKLSHRVEDFLSIAFDSSYHYGVRRQAVDYLKYAEKDARHRAGQILQEHVDDTNMDSLRMVLYGFGALGEGSNIEWFRDKHHVLTGNYHNEKLGTVLVESLISAYINTTDEHLLEYYPGRIIDAYNKTRDLGHMRLQPLHFFDQFRYLPKSRAKFLLRAFDANAHEAILLGLLFTLPGAPNPYLMDLLYKLREFPNVKQDALMGIAATGTSTSHNLLKSLISDPAAATPICCSIGVCHIQQEIEFLIQTLERHAKTELPYQYAVWSLGELASIGNPQALDRLRQEKEEFNEGYIRALALLGLAKSGEAQEEDLKESLEATTYFFERLIIGIAGAYMDSLEMVETGVLASYRKASPLWALQSHFLNDLRRGLKRGHADLERELTILLKA